ncbi:SecDF P1 head subdomain-containing protein [Actinophytocola sp.]|uniref:SecDF P1 head subdomain-containing protein n=1 Tax=Actinophytocola sp. TaxID=1872138 RepID=UPI002D7EC567|nr:precorrin-3B C(17)-methyltransferase [Actinophytocola sp.]HET9138270.1 precorrin-3B C(17)-methyltransferase [Actinophytocola sp.]
MRALRVLAVLAVLAGLAGCRSSTVAGTGDRAEPAQLEFRKVLTTEPAEASPRPAPSGSPGATAGPTTRQDPAFADPAAARAALDALDCAAADSLRAKVDPALPLVTCDPALPEKYVLAPAFLSGADVVRAGAELGPNSSGWTIAVTFSDAASRTWADFTTQNVGAKVAIVLDGRVVSAPTIEEPILAGTVIISGRFTKEEAERLAGQLNSR